MVANVKKSVLVLTSGGIDSTVLAKHYLDKGFNASGLFVDHNQGMLDFERVAVRKIEEILGLTAFEVAGGDFQYQGFFGPVRNAYLLTLAVNYAATHGFGNVAIGVSHGEYLDVRPEFIDRFNFVLDYCLKDPIYVLAPFAHWSKERVIKYGVKIKAPLNLTTSCMEYPSCGKCQDCRLRRKYGLDYQWIERKR